MKNIVVPTDFSNAAENATDYAIELAKQFDAKLTLVNAYPFPAVDYDLGFSITLVPEVEEYAHIKLSNLKEEIIKREPTLKIDSCSQMGSPLEVIDWAIQDIKPDILVIGITNEAGKFKEHILGSTAVDLVRHTTIPTFIIPQGIKFKPIHKISFACDLDKTEETDLIETAKYFVNLFNAELEILHIENPDKEIITLKSKTSYLIERELKKINHHTIHVLGDNVVDSLNNYFKTSPADLIMISPKHHHLFHKSVTKELAFHTKIPILTIH